MKWRDWDTNLKVRLYGEGVINLLFWLYFPFMSIYFAKFFGKGTAGFLLVISQCISVAANLFGGYCADKFGRKRMMVFSHLGTSVAYSIFLLANSPWYESPIFTFIAFSMLGIFGALYSPASHAMVADVVPEKERSHVFAVFYVMVNICVVIGPVLGAFFFFSYRFELLTLAFITSVIFTFTLQRLIRETAPGLVDLSIQNSKDNEKWYSLLKEQFRNYRVIITDKTFFLFIIAGILFSLTFMQIDFLLPVYISETVTKQTLFSIKHWTLDISAEQVYGIILAENALLVVLFTIYATKFSNRFKPYKVFMFSSCMYGISIFLFGQTTQIWGLIFTMLLFVIAELMVIGVQASFVAKLAKEKMLAQYYAAAGLRFTLGKTLAPMSIPLVTLIGYRWTFIIIALIAFTGAGLYYMMAILMRRKERIHIKGR
ncbi:MDR family MFS transporter [Chengkuizengella axinellae]|uniref:MFS transporter n=1 Tax=Chengkuizengella axinellae TaxID=3064388 RepID=A0ABT9J522_9BACL|nr:MFS transporter [Chengkuizengella sp. 2205SS18-9]MDP5276717.1 MFS transporter [Chengkuizengella sp. 2205SS18-9]